MYSDLVLWLLPLAALLWLGFLTFSFRKQNKFLKSLFPRSGERDIRKKFEELLVLERKLDALTKESENYISKVALTRYNPYEDTGGDQSFSVALLNKKKSGVVLTSLHSRSGTRVFAKPVGNGKAEHFQFSKEEEEVVNKD